MDIISILIGLILGASFGSVLAYIFIKKIQHSKEKEIIEKAHTQGENIKKDKIIQAKEKFLELKKKLKPLCENFVDFGNYLSENVELD